MAEQIVNNLYAELPDEALIGLAKQFAGNESLLKSINGIMAMRKAESDKLLASKQFAEAVAKIKLPSPPDGVYNMFFTFGEVEVEDTKQPKVEVEIVDAQAIYNVDAKGEKTLVTPAVVHKEKRHPKVKVMQWSVTTNHACHTNKAGNNTTSATPKQSKRSVEVLAVNGNQLQSKGVFANCTRACEELKLEIGGDSARRVLERAGYVVRDLDN